MTMKAAFITSLVSALMSLIAIFCLSAMTVVPGTGAEGERDHVELISAAFFVIWISLAFSLRPGPKPGSLPGWAQGLVVSAGVVYSIGILLVAVG